MESNKLKLSKDVSVQLVHSDGLIDEEVFYSYTAVEDGETVTFTIYAVDDSTVGAELEVYFPDGSGKTSGSTEYVGDSWTSPALTAGTSYDFVALNMPNVDQVVGIHMESNL